MRRDVRPFVQPYGEALRERMIMFGTDELDKLRAAMRNYFNGDDDMEDVTDPSTVFPEVPVRHQITSVTLSDEGLLGTSLAGAEIFEIPKSQLPETVTAATLIELAADAMGVMQNSLTLWEGMSCYVGYWFTTPKWLSGLLQKCRKITVFSCFCVSITSPLGPKGGSELVGAAVLGHGVTTLRETIADTLRPVVCRKGNQAGCMKSEYQRAVFLPELVKVGPSALFRIARTMRFRWVRECEQWTLKAFLRTGIIQDNGKRHQRNSGAVSTVKRFDSGSTLRCLML